VAETSFDTIVIGGGPGGYVAAIRAAQLGMKTAVVERENLGGICLNWGCIPTKALLRSAEVGHILHHLGDYGFSAKDVAFDTKKIVERSRKVAKQLSNGVGFLMRKHKITVIDGSATLSGGGKLSVAKEGKPVGDFAAKNIIVATGARARAMPGLEPDGKLIWTYREAMVPEKLPKSLLVIGSGAIGIEFASFYRDLGVEVTVVEVLDRVLPVEDEEISAFARKSFEKQGMKIFTSKIWGSKRPRRKSIAPISSSINGARPASPACTRSAMSSAPPGWRIRRCMKA
jgi:dihydrolipoamide dehydrogenase